MDKRDQAAERLSAIVHELLVKNGHLADPELEWLPCGEFFFALRDGYVSGLSHQEICSVITGVCLRILDQTRGGIIPSRRRRGV